MIDWQYLAIEDIVGERFNQDAQWGGEKTDDSRTYIQWLNFIQYQQTRALHADKRRDAFVKIAALALAAIESIDRKGSQS